MAKRRIEETERIQNEEIIKMCTAGVQGMLSDPLLVKADQLLSETASEFFFKDFASPLFYIRDQVLRSTGSIAANLAEGIGRGYRGDKRRVFMIARGEAYESTIWLRALNKPEQLKLCLELCNLLDARIIELTKEIMGQTPDIETTDNVVEQHALPSRRFGESMDDFSIRIAR